MVVVEEGDPCPNCGNGLKLDRAIEIGHIFQLGRKYADTFQLDVLGQQGKPVRVTMGSYGIGVSRAVAALAEQTADGQGLCWPAEVAPADVHVVAAGKALQTELALEVSEKLNAAGVRVLVDDRAGVSPGVKFTDAELIGVPKILVMRPPQRRRHRGTEGPPHRRARGTPRRRGRRPPHRLTGPAPTSAPAARHTPPDDGGRGVRRATRTGRARCRR